MQSDYQKFRRQKFRSRWFSSISSMKRRIFFNLLGIVYSLSFNNYRVLIIILIIIDNYNCTIIDIIDYFQIWFLEKSFGPCSLQHPPDTPCFLSAPQHEVKSKNYQEFLILF